MSGAQQIVGAGGAALVVLSLSTGDTGKTIRTGLYGDSVTAQQQAAARRELLKVGTSVLFVGVATICAGLSSAWGRAMTAVIVGLFILWAVNRYAPATPTTPAPTKGRKK